MSDSVPHVLHNCLGLAKIRIIVLEILFIFEHPVHRDARGLSDSRTLVANAGDSLWGYVSRLVMVSRENIPSCK